MLLVQKVKVPIGSQVRSKTGIRCDSIKQFKVQLDGSKSNFGESGRYDYSGRKQVDEGKEVPGPRGT